MVRRTWIPEGIEGSTICHLRGVPWNEAKLPWRWHFCHAQTFGYHGDDLVERCRCGAIQMCGDGIWVEKNSRRKA